MFKTMVRGLLAAYAVVVQADGGTGGIRHQGRFEMIRLIVGMIVVLSIVISCDSSRAAWLVNTYRDGSTVNNLAAALNLINTTLPIASGNLALGDMLATHSGIYDTKNARI